MHHCAALGHEVKRPPRNASICKCYRSSDDGFHRGSYVLQHPTPRTECLPTGGMDVVTRMEATFARLGARARKCSQLLKSCKALEDRCARVEAALARVESTTAQAHQGAPQG
jgi:hypothetical protein